MTESTSTSASRRAHVEQFLGPVKNCALTALATLVLAACGKAPDTVATMRGAIQAEVSYPSSAAYDADSGSLLIGSYGDGSIHRVPASNASRHAHRPPVPPDGRLHVFRIRVDPIRARTWVLAPDAVYLYHSHTSRLLARIAADEMAQHSDEHCLPDMAVDSSGNVFVSSAMQPQLMRIDAVTLEATRRTLEPDAEKGKDFGLSALAFAADGVTLYAASATIGVLWKIDYARGVASKVELSQRIMGACALRVSAPARPGGRVADAVLYVAGGFRNGVQRVELSPASAPLRVTTMNVKATSAVPTDFVAINRDLFIVGSRLADHPDFQGPGARASSFSLLPVQTP